MALPAAAGRPLLTEDAGVLARGNCEVESLAGQATERGQPSTSTVWAQLGCGIGLRTQLAAGGGHVRSAGRSTYIDGIAGKTFLRELTETAAGFAIAYGVFGAREPDDHFRRDASELKAVLTVPLERWLIHANLGLLDAHRAATDRTTWALAGERAGALGPVDLMAEIVGNNREPALVQLAARWVVLPGRFSVDASWGRRGGDTRPTLVTIGLKLGF